MFLLILPHAHAFYEPESLILTPTVGQYVFDSTSNTESSPTLGVRADYCLATGSAGNIGLEAFVNATQLKSKTDSSSGNAYLLRVGPLFAFPGVGKVTPFLTAGI